MNRISVFAIIFTLFIPLGSYAQYASSSKTPKKAGDLIESTSYNDHKRGAPRMLQYLPSGEEFVCVNGKNRYTRALYGGHTAWRLETGDRPIFATYVKNDCRNIRFRLHLPDGTVTPLEETDWCEARYNPGTRTYALKDKAWGENCSLKVSVLASLTEEMAVWELSGELPASCELEVLNSPIRRKKLSRSGDMGADPPGCFEPAEDGTVLQTLKCRFPADGHLYVGISGNELKEMRDGGVQYLALQKACRELAGRIRILGVMQRLALCYGATAIIALTMKHRHIPYLIATLLVGYFILLMCGNGFAYNETNILSIVDRAILTPAHMYKDNGIDPEGLLSTIPSIAHVLLGFCVGRMMLDSNRAESREALLNSHLIKLFLVGAILTFAGFLLSYGCPINKKIWSPTFVLTTCGLASSFLALLIWIIDVKGYKKWCTFFEAFGVNPLFMYVLGGVLSILFGSISFPWGDGSISIHGFLYKIVLMPIFGETGGSLAYALLFVAINWCIGYQLYKRKIYIKI